MTAQQSSRPSGGQPVPGTGTSLPPGAQIVVRDEEWLVKNVTRTDHDGDRIEAVGVSEFVRDLRPSSSRAWSAPATARPASS